MIAPALVALAIAAEPVPEAAPAPRVIDDKERVRLQQTDTVRLSLPTQEDVAAWQQPGLRVALGYGYGFIDGRGPAYSFRSHSFALRPSVRLDADWGAGLTLMYSTGPNGMRWSVTAEPTFYLWRQLALTIGLGFGGLMVADFQTGNVGGQGEQVSRDLRGDEHPGECVGSALTGLGRVEYQMVVGPLFASGPFLQGHAQRTRCQLRDYAVDRTGQKVVFTQWWTMTGATLGWWLSWR